MSKKQRSIYLLIAGILQISLSFVCAFIGVVGLAATLTIVGAAPEPIFQWQLAISVYALLAFTLGFTGGVLTLKQTRLQLAIIGLIAILSWNVFAIIRSLRNMTKTSFDIIMWLAIFIFQVIFACISLAFTIVSRKEFH